MTFSLSVSLSLKRRDETVLLREFYMRDTDIKQLCSFNDLLQTLCKNIQRSHYEQLIIKLASAYDGYHFDLPAFLDFRGRICRSGILHFHERDLARSLILFADGQSINNTTNQSINNTINPSFLASAAFHYQSFSTIEESVDWLRNQGDKIIQNPILYSREGKHPFQFLSNLIAIKTAKQNNIIPSIPITQDASASAYQIMSYFLLDETLAKRTNLIPSSDGKSMDIYSLLLEELREYMKTEHDNNLSKVVCDLLTRKIVKGIFMPIIYGKTIKSTADDLKETPLYQFITGNECTKVASVCFQFWKTKYHGLECLIRLIRNIGWIASARGSPVFYRVPYFTTVQDYMKMEPAKIWVYDRVLVFLYMIDNIYPHLVLLREQKKENYSFMISGPYLYWLSRF